MPGQAVERDADKLEELAERTAEDDAAFRRKLQPSLMVKRAKREAPTDAKPGGRPKPIGKRKGPSPWVVLGGAIVGGYFLAKVVDWRGHGNPSD